MEKNTVFIFDDRSKMLLLPRELRKQVNRLVKKTGYLGHEILPDTVIQEEDILEQERIKDSTVIAYNVTNKVHIVKSTFDGETESLYVFFVGTPSIKKFGKLWAIHSEVKDELQNWLYKKKINKKDIK